MFTVNAAGDVFLFNNTGKTRANETYQWFHRFLLHFTSFWTSTFGVSERQRAAVSGRRRKSCFTAAVEEAVKGNRAEDRPAALACCGRWWWCCFWWWHSLGPIQTQAVMARLVSLLFVRKSHGSAENGHVTLRGRRENQVAFKKIKVNPAHAFTD